MDAQLLSLHNSSKFFSHFSIAILICSFALGCAPERVVEQDIDELWSAIMSDEEDKELILKWCKELESLARKQPELYADYLVGANAKASAQFKNYDEWKIPLNKGLEDLARYGDSLSLEHIFHTKVFILYEDARIHDSKGLVGLAEDKYQKVWESLPKAHPDLDMLVTFQNALPISLAQLALFKGDYKQAESWLDILWGKLKRDHKEYPGIAYGLAAQVEEAKGNDSLAIEHYKTAIQYFLANIPGAKPGHYMETCMNYAEFLRQRGDFDQALSVISEASKQQLEGERYEVYKTYQLAKIHLSKGHLDEALQQINKALLLSKRVTQEEYYWHAKILSVQAEIELAQGNWTAAVKTAQLGLDQLNTADIGEDIETSPDPREIESKLDALPLLVIKARALFGGQGQTGKSSLENLNLALETFTRAIELIRILRAEYKDDEVKEFLSSSSYELFEPAISTAYTLYQETDNKGYLLQGLKIAETSRSLSLLENLKGHQIQSQLGIPAKVLAEEDDLKLQISKLEKTLKQAKDQSGKTQYRKLLQERRKAYQAWQEKLQEKYPTYYELKYQEEPIVLEEIQSSLVEDEAMLSFFWGEESIYGILISANQANFQAIEHEEELDKAIQTFREQIASRTGGTTVGKLKKLIASGHTVYDQLLTPFDKLPENIILVTDGPLHYLSLAALPTEIIETESPNEIPFLVKEHAIKRIFSVSIWLRHTRSQKAELQSPIRPTGDTLLVVAPATFPNNSQLTLDSTELREIFGEKVRLVREANTARVKALLQRDYKYVLIFSHASAGKGRPYIQLSDDRLYLEEIYHTHMDTRFIVLGACESGVGEDRKGEGVLSLGRAFIYQDVPNAAMSLWKVPDAHSLTITQTLLGHHIKEGLDPADALRSAQLAFLKNEPLALPYKWAGFVAIGQ